MAETKDIIPETVDEALALWDGGHPVFTVEMGGLGPGYEQAIQIMAFELMREFRRMDLSNRAATVAKRDEVITRVDKKLGGVSGAMVGAATSLAMNVVNRGYRTALRDPAVADRLIQVSREMPQAPAVPQD